MVSRKVLDFMEAFLWLFLPVLVAAGTAFIVYYIMEARTEVAVAKERESLAEANAIINSQKINVEERVRATEESAKRRALDDFMQDLRVEERSYVREFRSANASKKSMVMQERLFFRNIPLSNWIEHEMIVDEGSDLERLPKESVFGGAGSLPAAERTVAAKFLQNGEAAESAPVLLTTHANAFGAR